MLKIIFIFLFILVALVFLLLFFKGASEINRKDEYSAEEIWKKNNNKDE